MLMSHQVSIFCGLMLRTASQVLDVRDAGIWVCDPELQSIDEIEPLSGTDLYRVRSVPGVRWAVRLSKGLGRVRTANGLYRSAIVMGLDDDSFVGAPPRMLLGSWQDLRRPDGVILDDAGFSYLFPGQPDAGVAALAKRQCRQAARGGCRAGRRGDSRLPVARATPMTPTGLSRGGRPGPSPGGSACGWRPRSPRGNRPPSPAPRPA